VQYIGHMISYSASFPATGVVSIYYWIFFYVDRELIDSKVMNEYLPFWISLVQHGVILPVALFNILYQRFDAPRRISYSIGFCCTILYYIWLMHIYGVTGEWVYPFMTAMGKEKQMFGVFPLTICVTGLFQKLGFTLNQMIHSPARENNKKEK